MNLDDLLHETGQEWTDTQPTAPPLDDAVRRAASRRTVRPKIAIAASVFVIAGVAAIPLVRSATHQATTRRGPLVAGTDSPTPTTSISPPNGSVLRKLVEIASNVAKTNEGPNASAEAVRTTFAKASAATDRDQSSEPAGSTDVWVIQLHGNFTCEMCSAPGPNVVIRGRAITLLLDARTYREYGFNVTHEPYELSTLGRVIPLILSTPQVSSAASTAQSAPPDPQLPKLTRIALDKAKENGDRYASAEAVRTTFGKVEHAVRFGASSTPPGDTPVWVIQLSGSFVCELCHGPAGARPPKGHALVLIRDAETLAGIGTGLADGRTTSRSSVTSSSCPSPRDDHAGIRVRARIPA